MIEKGEQPSKQLEISNDDEWNVPKKACSKDLVGGQNMHEVHIANSYEFLQVAGTLSPFVCWNVRSINKPFKQKEIKNFLHKNKFEICVMFETRFKDEKFKKVSSLMFRDWSVINNNDDAAANGRIWIDWNPKIWDITSCASCAQAIHCKVVHLESNICFTLIDVYAFNT